jgi:hypothetical protein
VVKLNQLIERLCDAQIDFVIVGGFAGILHGSTLVTRDLDVCTVLSPENIMRLRATFRDLQPKHRFTTQKFSFLDNPEPGVHLKNLYLETDLGPVDLTSRAWGSSRRCEQRR